MDNWWSDEEAERFVREQAQIGVDRDLALRVFTSRLLGRQPKLVLHGGGNTSVKLRATDLVGEEIDVLHVKGSGWDMADIEAPGLPAVRLKPLLALRALARLSDEDMVDALRGNLLNSKAPNPSVETLLHAFLPHRFIDHTHSVALLALVDQADSRSLVERVFGRRLGFVPYVIPGFALAKLAADVFEADPEVEGLVLDKHGLFTFGDTARQAYERMIDFVSLAEDFILRKRTTNRVSTREISGALAPETIAPLIRGAFAAHEPKTPGPGWIVELRTGEKIREFVDGAHLARYGVAGVATPDHVIRTKPWPLILNGLAAGNTSGLKDTIRAAVDRFVADYVAYFDRHNARVGGIKRPLDALPRIVIIPGLGFFGAGRSAKEAKIAADVYESAIETILAAESVGRFQSIGEADLFDMEYWSLEQAKLGKSVPPPLAGRIAVITGGAGTIGLATAKAFAAAGAEIALLDLNEEALDTARNQVGGAAIALACDVTRADDLERAFTAVCRRFGGIDILVSNAGAALQGPIAELSDEDLRRSFELNFFAHQAAAKRAVAVMQAQGVGGCLLFNTSKQAINPGANFGAYGLPKAATLFLSRQYALEHGKDGIRSNAVNADRIRSGILTPEMVRSRSEARGISETDYLAGNLLGQEVTADDVAKAFVDLALSPKTTGAVLTVDGGNIAAALR